MVAQQPWPDVRRVRAKKRESSSIHARVTLELVVAWTLLDSATSLMPPLLTVDCSLDLLDSRLEMYNSRALRRELIVSLGP